MWEGISSESKAERDFLAEDLNKMHCYRDAILGTRGAYILFPGADGEDADDQPPYLRWKNPPNRGAGVPSVGAFRLRPSAEQVHRTRLRRFLAETIDSLIRTTAYREEEGI
jgi:predicted component of viral defense system (DUF524 family)